MSVIAIGVVYYFYNHHSKNSEDSNSPDQAISLQRFQQVHSQALDSSLKNKDYAGYQENQREYASTYIGYKNYTEAQSIMNNIFQNVPADQIQSATYLVMVDLQQAKGDNAQQKHYLQLLITAFNKEGDSQDAADFQGRLNKL